MPEFVLNRNYTLRSTMGHIINFHTGQPTYVPPVCVTEVLNIGADPVESMDKTAALLGDEPAKPTPPLTPAERQARLEEGFTELEKLGNRNDFSAGGIPTGKALERVLGFEPERRERDNAWLAYKEKKVNAQ